MGTAHIHKTITIHAPIELVFERISDHEGMADWPGISRAELVRTSDDGDDPNGRGAVRKLTARGLTLLEEVVHFEPPNVIEYTITKGLPVKHIGRVELEADGDDTHVAWTVVMASGWPLIAELVGKLLDRGLGPALGYVKKRCEADAASAPKSSTSRAARSTS